MKKKIIVLSVLTLMSVIGIIATIPIWKRAWERYAPQQKVAIDSDTRAKAVDMLVTKLNTHYVFPDTAKQIEAVLRHSQRNGKYDQMTDGEELAKRLTEELGGVAHDRHMEVEFSPTVVPADFAVEPPPATQEEWDKQNGFLMRLSWRLYLPFSNISVEKVAHLDAKVGYLQLSAFPPAFLVANKYAAAMDKLADTDALIVDLRENRGGDPQAVALLISYFVDRPTRLNDMWDRDTGITTQSWTQDRLGGKPYGAAKPIVILAGPETMSAGEDFAYTMQAMKRATVIGKPTWGGAHPTLPYRIGEHFLAWVPSRRTISPITHTNWEGVGVVPDIVVSPDRALDLAKDLLQRRLRGSALADSGH